MANMKQGPNLQKLEKLIYALLKKYQNILGEHLDVVRVEEIIERIINYHESIIDCMPGNAYWLDKNCNAVGCNKNVLDMFGFKSIADFKGLTFEEMGRLGNWTPEATESFKKDTLEVINTGKAKLNIEEPPIPHHDGKIIYFLTSRVPLFNRMGAVVGVVGISIDITERKELERNLKTAIEKSEAASKAKTEFIANMSHDVKTPLSGIISISEALCSRVQEEYRDLTQDVLQAGQHLMVFFENCIELSKLESGSIVLSKETFSLRQLLNEILNLFRPAMRAKGLAWRVDCDEKIPKRLLGGRVTLYRILLNLVGNAVKFTPQGSIAIRTELSKNSTPEKAIIKLSITDTGIGIPVDKQKLIFERFARLTPSYQGVYEGSGIGLYIVEEFVKSMGGEIHIKSEEGKGSRFTVVVPLQIPLLADNEYDDLLDPPLPLPHGNLAQSKIFADKPIAYSIQKAEPVSTQTAASQIKVLLVEDNLMAQKGASLLLSSLGCKVDVASCGKEAITLFKPGYYALVLMDIGLPDMKGYEVARHLKQLEESTSFVVPILGLSAHATEDEKQLSSEVGMSEIFSKPLLSEQARAILMQYVPIVQASINENLLAMEDDLRVIDLQKAPDGSSGAEQAAWEILDELIGSLPEYRAEFEKAYMAHDKELLRAELHKFRGGLCYTKVPHLLQAVSILETNLRNGEYSELDVLYAKVLKAMETLDKVYQSL